MPVLGKRSVDNLKGVHPDMVKLMTAAIKKTPVDFTITEGLRTVQRQQELYRIGRRGIVGEHTVTQKDGVKSKSNHQAKSDGYGHAVDLYPYYNGSVQVQDKGVPAAQKKIAAHIKSVAKELGIKIVWGGDWKTPYDPPHFELG